jgi:hypothetical protein
MASSRCRVSFTDSEGIHHGVDVDAESLYEAVAIAVASLVHHQSLRPFVPSCVSFQLRPLPFTGITRLPRYSEPLRHPTRPGLSLTSCQLIPTAITGGVSRVASGPCFWHAIATTPAGPMGLFARPLPLISAFPVVVAGQLLH